MSTKTTAQASNRFRETLWFKKGDDDSIAAEVVADAAIAGKVVDFVVADNLPIEDRYRDDGALTGDDSKRYSLRTGTTQQVPHVPTGPMPRRWRKKVSERELISEMTPTRPWLMLATVLISFGVGAALVFTGVADPVLALLR